MYMKKISVILVALLLLLASMSLSAESKWTLWGEGILYPYYQVGSADATTGWGPADWAAAGLATGQYSEWGLKWDGDNFGFYGFFVFDGKTLVTAPSPLALGVGRFGAYYKFFNNMAKLTMGAPRVDDYRFTTKIEGGGVTRLVDGAYAGLLEVYPIEHLSAGVILYIDNVLPFETLDSRDIGACLAYEFPNIAAIRAAWNNDKNLLNATVKVTALKGIDLMAGYEADWTAADLESKVFASGGGAVGPVNLAVDAGLDMIGDTTSFAAELRAEYALNDMWKIGVLGGYDNGVGLNGSGEGTPANGFAIFPYFKAGFGDSYVKVGFVYAGGYDAHGIKAKTDQVIAIPIMYVVSF